MTASKRKKSWSPFKLWKILPLESSTKKKTLTILLLTLEIQIRLLKPTDKATKICLNNAKSTSPQILKNKAHKKRSKSLNDPSRKSTLTSVQRPLPGVAAILLLPRSLKSMALIRTCWRKKSQTTCKSLNFSLQLWTKLAPRKVQPSTAPWVSKQSRPKTQKTPSTKTATTTQTFTWTNLNQSGWSIQWASKTKTPTNLKIKDSKISSVTTWCWAIGWTASRTTTSTCMIRWLAMMWLPICWIRIPWTGLGIEINPEGNKIPTKSMNSFNA